MQNHLLFISDWKDLVGIYALLHNFYLLVSNILFFQELFLQAFDCKTAVLSLLILMHLYRMAVIALVTFYI